MPKSRKARISISVIDKMEPGETVFDTVIKGFGARCQSASVSYFIKTRVKGRQRWITIGRHGSPWTPDLARKAALKLLADVVGGVDPSESKRRERSNSSLFEDVAARFLELHGKKLKPKTQEVYSYLVRLQINPSLGKRRIEEIARTDVSAFHHKWSEKPRTANHALAVLSKILSWAEQEGLRPLHSNPCFGVTKYRENKRERFLSPDELAALGTALAAAEATQNPYAVAAIRLLVLTGARVGEILSLKWSYIDEGRRLILLPDSKTGAKAIPLNQPAFDVLAGIMRIESNPFVLPGHIHGTHLVNIQKPWRDIRGAAGLGDVRLHDLRHSFASVAVASGGSLHILGKVLGHSQPQTTARYAHLADDPVSNLSEAVAATISKAMGTGAL
jgi:integrase